MIASEKDHRDAAIADLRRENERQIRTELGDLEARPSSSSS
ncbi:hypothetical protein ACFORO_19650 [Amycolatopsis halotolerans]|uniref:Uncharacterized protein n=1 Tax=Amycolatopsis halotolerans TaxID=330083 RepID=A0ABV7QGF0_9PSEU